MKGKTGNTPGGTDKRGSSGVPLAPPVPRFIVLSTRVLPRQGRTTGTDAREHRIVQEKPSMSPYPSNNRHSPPFPPSFNPKVSENG